MTEFVRDRVGKQISVRIVRHDSTHVKVVLHVEVNVRSTSVSQCVLAKRTTVEPQMLSRVLDEPQFNTRWIAAKSIVVQLCDVVMQRHNILDSTTVFF